MITKDQKTVVIDANKTHEGDTGSPEVQIAILTERIRQLTEYLSRKDIERYRAIIAKLGIRK